MARAEEPYATPPHPNARLRPQLGLPEAVTDALLRADSLDLLDETRAALTIAESLVAANGADADATLRRKLLQARGRLRYACGDGVGSEADLQTALELATAAHDTTTMCDALRWLAPTYVMRGEPRTALASARTLLQLAVHHRDHNAAAVARWQFANDDRTTGDWNAAETGYLAALATFREHSQAREELEALLDLAQARCAARSTRSAPPHLFECHSS